MFAEGDKTIILHNLPEIEGISTLIGESVIDLNPRQKSTFSLGIAARVVITKNGYCSQNVIENLGSTKTFKMIGVVVNCVILRFGACAVLVTLNENSGFMISAT